MAKAQEQSKPRRTQASRRQAAERRLLDAAIRLIAERGIKGTTLGDVGEKAGFSRGLTAHYCKSKKGLICAVAAEIHRRTDERLRTEAAHTEGLARLRLTITLYLQPDDDTSVGRTLHLLQKESLMRQSEFGDVLRDFNHGSIATFAGMIQACIDRGEIRGDVDPRTEATLILATLRGARGQWLLTPDEVDADAVTAEIIDQIERGLAPT